MPGTLYVVATPIGNLEDVTLRALRILREVSVIAAEDTRRTSRLLQHYSISTPTTSLHEHNETAQNARAHRSGCGRANPLRSCRMRERRSCRIPERRLVAAAHAAGIRVEPVPGRQCRSAAISASGIGGDGFLFVGLPASRGRRPARMARQLALPRQRPCRAVRGSSSDPCDPRGHAGRARRPNGCARPGADKGARRIGR